MPQAIVAGIGLITGATVSTAVTVAVYAATFVGTIALSNSQKRKADRVARAQAESAIVDRLVNTQSTVGKRELALGRLRKGGTVFFQTAVAPHNAVFLTLTTLAAHEIDGIERVYFNDTPLEIDGDGNVTTSPWGRTYTRTEQGTSYDPVRVLDHPPIEGSIRVLPMYQWGTPDSFYPQGATSAPYTLDGNVLTITNPIPEVAYTVSYQWSEFISTARVYGHLGSVDQVADARLKSFLPGTWTDAHRARGVAYLLCEFVYEEASFPSGLPTITVQFRGAKLHDPRHGVTSFSENPALMMRHVMLHPQFGKRTSLTAAEEARIAAAANACDTPMSYWTGAPIVPMYRANGVFLFGTPARDVLDDLAQSMAGEWAYGRGEYSLRAGVYQAPVMALTEADLATVIRNRDGSVTQIPFTVSVHKPRNDKINVVAPRIFDEAAGYVEVAVPPYKAEAYIARDGAEISEAVDMANVFNAGQATHIAGIMLRDNRDALSFTASFKMRAWPLELFDGVTMTLARYGWFDKEFRILGRKFDPTTCIVELTMKETAAAIFQYGAGFLPGGYASNSGLPRPWDITTPVITSITSGESELIVQPDGTIVNSILVQWAPLTDASVIAGGTVEVNFQVLPDGQWRQAIVAGDSTEVRLFGVEDRALVWIRVRSRNSLAASDWSVAILHSVVGKTEPPPNIENLSIAGSVLSWSLPRRVPDLAGYVFRFHYGNNLDWNSAAPLHTGVLTESPYDLITRPGGLVTIMGKAIDTSGIMSRVTANIIMNLGDPAIANIVEEFDFRAMGWPSSRLYLPEGDYLLTDGLGNYLTDQDGNYLTTGFGALIQTEQRGWTEIDGVLQADALDSFYGDDDQSFYGLDFDSFYDVGAYSQMVYVTGEISLNSALAGSVMTLIHEAQGVDLRIEYRKPGPGSFYGDDNQSFYGDDAAPFYGPPGPWQSWPGQLVAQNDSYQFRVTIGGGTTRGILSELKVIVDAPDIVERINDLAVAAGGTLIPYAQGFTKILNINGTLQANASNGVTLETTKTPNLAPVVRVFDAAHTSVGGATVDLTIYGY